MSQMEMSPEDVISDLDDSRRRSPSNDRSVGFADIVVEPGSHVVTRGSREIAMTRREFELLYFFVTNPRLVLTRHQILDAVWGWDGAASANSVDVYVGYLRRKLESDGAPRVLHTVHGIGYALREDWPK